MELSSCLGSVCNHTRLAPGCLGIVRLLIIFVFLAIPDNTTQAPLKACLELAGHKGVMGSSLRFVGITSAVVRLTRKEGLVLKPGAKYDRVWHRCASKLEYRSHNSNQWLKHHALLH